MFPYFRARRFSPSPLVGEGEQPCSVSSDFWVPRGVAFNHGVHDGQQLAHAGHDHHFRRFAGSLEALGQGLDHRIAALGADCGHVQDTAHIGTTAPDVPLPAVFPAVTVERCNADQFGDLASVQLPDLGAAAKHRAAGDLTHPRNAQQHVDRKSTRLNSSHVKISYAVFCLKKKKKKKNSSTLKKKKKKTNTKNKN